MLQNRASIIYYTARKKTVIKNMSSFEMEAPLVLELNRVQNHLKEKERELGAAQSEIKALRATEVLKDKAVEELENEMKRFGDKLGATENLLDQKNLYIMKLTEEKREANYAQYAAEATLRRVYADQKDDSYVPVESIIAPLEADIKMYKNEIASLQEDKRAVERLNKSKEAALLEAERILKSALERALVVEEVQNQNFELRRQIEICQEENKILEKTNRQKVVEVEKLTSSIKELEDAILAGGEAANKIRDYQRQVSELQDEKRTLERELARFKVTANRVATVVANEWKDENDKVMPVKQWLEERRLLQAEMQRLRGKLSIVEKTAKAEAQLKDKLKLRLNTLESGLKNGSSPSVSPNTYTGTPKPEKPSNFFGVLSSNGGQKKRSVSQPRGSAIRSPRLDMEKANADFAEKVKQNSNTKRFNSSIGFWGNRKKIDNSTEKENQDTAAVAYGDGHAITEPENIEQGCKVQDVVSGFLYDRLQKEVLTLRKTCEIKDSNLNSRDEDIKMLTKKIETLTKAFKIECKKAKREATIKAKDQTVTKVDEKMRNTISSRRVTRTPQRDLCAK